jgi:uncharacterized YigZ family protein
MMLYLGAVKGRAGDVTVEREHNVEAAGDSAVRTIASGGQHETVVKGSRFVCVIERTGDEATARAFIDSTRRRFWNASHTCTAWRLGPDGQLERSNDDGEPPGTAGAPMLAVLRGHELVDLTATVSRYFGGTLLGTGGLIRAYGTAVTETIARIGIVQRQPRQALDVSIEHGEAGRIEHALRTGDLALTGVVYGERDVTFTLAVDPADTVAVERQIAQLTNGMGRVIRTAVRHVDVPVSDHRHRPAMTSRPTSPDMAAGPDEPGR